MSELMIKENALIKAELDTQITTAKAYPRDINRFMDEAMQMATFDQETAESCIYAVPRGKGTDQKFIKGESIRLAEIMQIAWGNMHVGSRITSNDGKTITAEGAAWDLEKNVKVIKEVKRSITGKFGPFTPDMQVVTGNAACSIAMRNAIFSVVPKAFVKKVYDAAVSMAIGDQKTINTKISALFDKFKKMGIQPEMILSYFEKTNQAEITKEEYTEMIGIGTSIKDGILSIDKAFVLVELEKKTNTQPMTNIDKKLAEAKEKANPKSENTGEVLGTTQAEREQFVKEMDA
jgi:hypothetical protein